MDEELLAGRYQRVRALGSGGMGDVWLADDLELGRLVAVKRLRFGVPSGQDAELVERMTREARVVARLHHPAIVTLHDLVRVDGRPHLIMQYVEGESLADRIGREGVVEWRAAARVVADVAGGLAAAHRAGVLHRDVKPANVLIDTEGRGHLADFGIARGKDDAAITRAGEMVGTVAFMPPEVARDNAATAASDVWSLGATLFAAVEGRPPFAGSGSSVPAILARLVSDPAPPPTRGGACTGLLVRMLAADPTARPTAEQVVEEIDAVLTRPSMPFPSTEAVATPRPAPPTVGDGVDRVPPPTPAAFAGHDTPTQHGPPTPAPARRRRRGAVLLAAAAVAALVAGTAVAVVLLGGRGDGGSAGPGGAGEGDGTAPAFTSVAVGASPLRAELADGVPDGLLYVAAADSDTVTVVDPATGGTTEIGVCRTPGSIVVAPDGSRAYVGCRSGAVSVVDGTGEVDRFSVGAEPNPLSLTDDGRLLFVPLTNGEILVFDAVTSTEVGRTGFGTAPGLVHPAPDGTAAYTADPASGAIARIDLDDPADPVVTEIGLPDSPTGLQVGDDGERVYVTLENGQVQLVGRGPDGDTLTTAYDLPAPAKGRFRIQPGTETPVAWIPDPERRKMYVVDAISGTGIQTIDLAGRPGALPVFDSTGSTVYTVDQDNRVVLAIDTTTFRVTRVEGTGDDPHNLTVSPDDRTLYVVDWAGQDEASGRLLAVPLG